MLIFISLTIFSTIGGWIGAGIGTGGWLGLWSIFLGGVGGIVGIYLGFKVGKYFF